MTPNGEGNYLVNMDGGKNEKERDDTSGLIDEPHKYENERIRL
jgi:hypothetical protein